MKKSLPALFLIILCSFAFCKKEQNSADDGKFRRFPPPVIKDGGKTVEFASGSPQISLFAIYKASFLSYDLKLDAPATVIGKMKRSGSTPIVLFASPDLTQSYSSFLQNQSLIQIAQSNYNRTKDLYDHGAATGKELNDASAELYNKQSSIAEDEAKLRRDGFDPKRMAKAPNGTVWLISDLPESDLNRLIEGINCDIFFPSFPKETFKGKVEAIAEVINSETRKARIRIYLHDAQDKLRPGMYGKVRVSMPENGLLIPKAALFSSNGKYYIFIKKNDNIFERREVQISSEHEGLIEIAEGLEENEDTVISNVFLLKGLSFGI
ncbi:MAG TPA: efflux RND transporter periplasmic adaptor subunit [Leptospiraceae bacterium]|nr:efflux RND transporter periplasmic adaptor subunit [Leptospiraceae bacterium]HMZ58796.1 efflux RND transporter periplasmic adaptor subunit [Leptospiraceae bacterium]HNF24071.1 efflux RND transporter periplasmic adaptor subunit [Leptospiraceae bacterium]HNI96386.1 efflux RND transporter periplasmic adaptor subunit [Leptospiraceae bacterium]HNM04135.1 efflux RND transporter periplasmic adaptor subunit [Leptospiraceae bacterium]